MLAVIVLHIAVNNYPGKVGSIGQISSIFWGGVTRFCVPVFIMISGSLFLDKKYNLEIKKLYLCNIKKLIITLGFWALLYELANKKAMPNILNTFKVLSTQPHLWYLYMLIGIYIWIPAVRRFVHSSSKELLQYTILLLFILSSLYHASISFWGPNVISIFIQKMGMGMENSYIGYFLLGYYLNNYKLKKFSFYFIEVLGFLSILITLYLTFRISHSSPMDERFYYYLQPGIYLYSSSIFILAQKVDIKSPWVQLIVQELASKSFGIYLVHMIFVLIFWSGERGTFIYYNTELFLRTIVVLVLSYICTSLLKNIPIINKWIV